MKKKSKISLWFRKLRWVIVSIVIAFLLFPLYLYFYSPNILVITRPQDKIDNLPALQQTITDKQMVMKLYYKIYMLPEFPPGTIFCPSGYFAKYHLSFYRNKTLVLKGVLNPTGCTNIVLSNGKIKWATDRKFINYNKDIQKVLQLSNKDFYGSQNGKSLR